MQKRRVVHHVQVYQRHIKVGKNVNNQTRFIFQKAKFNINQAVTTNVCVHAGKKCQSIDDEHLHSSRCEQRYGHLALCVFVKHEVIADDFYLPSCCVCINDKKPVFVKDKQAVFYFRVKF